MVSSPFAKSGYQPPAVVVPQHHLSPTLRELRAQAVHRIQIGLFGLAGMLLLVGLANIIMDRARINDDATAEAASAAAAGLAGGGAPETASPSPASDPLANIGVVPDLPAASEAAPDSAANPPPPAGQ